MNQNWVAHPEYDTYIARMVVLGHALRHAGNEQALTLGWYTDLDRDDQGKVSLSVKVSSRSVQRIPTGELCEFLRYLRELEIAALWWGNSYHIQDLTPVVNRLAGMVIKELKRRATPRLRSTSPAFDGRTRLDAQTVLAKIDPLDVYAQVLEIVDIRTSRGNVMADRCPLHSPNERQSTPSFSIQLETGLFYCFVCQRGGSLFDFFMQTEGLNFPQAVERVAELGDYHE